MCPFQDLNHKGWTLADQAREQLDKRQLFKFESGEAADSHALNPRRLHVLVSAAEAGTTKASGSGDQRKAVIPDAEMKPPQWVPKFPKSPPKENPKSDIVTGSFKRLGSSSSLKDVGQPSKKPKRPFKKRPSLMFL